MSVRSAMMARVVGLVRSAKSDIYCLLLNVIMTENVIDGFSIKKGKSREKKRKIINFLVVANDATELRSEVASAAELQRRAM